MNARSQKYEIQLEGHQIEEALSSIFHTLLLHRTVGKFHYKAESSYSIGTIGVIDVDCDYLDLTFVRVNSSELSQRLRQQISGFKDALRQNEGHKNGQISLEFYQKKRRQWPFREDQVPWEIWTLSVDVLQLHNESERQKLREIASDAIAEIIMEICCCVNRDQYMPKMPVQSDLSLIFDTSLSDVQPYLYKDLPALASSTIALPKHLQKMVNHHVLAVQILTILAKKHGRPQVPLRQTLTACTSKRQLNYAEDPERNVVALTAERHFQAKNESFVVLLCKTPTQLS